MPSATVARRTRVLAGMSIFAWKEVCGKVRVEDWTFCWLFLRITIESLLQENVSELQPLFRLIEGAGGTRIRDLRLPRLCADETGRTHRKNRDDDMDSNPTSPCFRRPQAQRCRQSTRELKTLVILEHSSGALKGLL